MSFTDLLKQDGVGHVWLIEVSNDNFSTIAHRWCDKPCNYGAHRFDARIVKIGTLQKAFGLDGFPTVSTVSLVLDNTAFDMDWLVDVSGGPIEFLYRFRLTLVLFDPALKTPAIEDLQSIGFAQVMGNFGMLDSPARTPSTVELSLADDSMGRFNELASSPTINDWIADGGTTVNNCLLKSPTNQSAVPNISFDAPLPIVFGPSAMCQLATLKALDNGGTLVAAGYTHAIIVCATTSSDAVSGTDAIRLDGTFRPDTMLGTSPWEGAGTTFSIPGPSPQGVTISSGDTLGRPAGTYIIWSAQKTQAIAKDGKSWKILWIAFNANAWTYWATNHQGFGYISGYNPDGSWAGGPIAAEYPYLNTDGNTTPTPEKAMAAFDHFTVTGYPFSAVTDKTSQYQSGVNVLQDLIASYSHGSSADVDTTAFATALKVNPVLVQQVLLPLPEAPSTQRRFLSPVAAAIAPGQLRQAIGELCASIAVDVFFTWTGLFSVSAGWFDFTSVTAARITIDETLMQNVRERKPSQGERWTYYNRLYVQGPDGQLRGPFDNSAAVASAGIAVPRTIVGKWLVPDISGGDPGYEAGIWQLWPRLEAKARNLVTFQTDKTALQLDLGSLFVLTWTRGNSQAVYTAAVFRIEQISLDPSSLAVTIETVWVDDLSTINPYLLDDEAHTGVAASVGGSSGTVTVADHSSTVTFSSFNPVTGGVVAGDILLIEDSTEADNSFKRNKTVRITARTATTATVVDDVDGGDYGGGGALGTWAIFHGKTTYPTAGSDPTNYPSGSAMYGKVTNAGGVFSDSTAGNQLLDG